MAVETTHSIRDVFATFQPCRRALEGPRGQFAFSWPDEGPQPEYLNGNCEQSDNQNYEYNQPDLHPPPHLFSRS
jgi:hypothetical protein